MQISAWRAVSATHPPGPKAAKTSASFSATLKRRRRPTVINVAVLICRPYA